MKVPDIHDYMRIFLKAILYDSPEKIAGYFNEVKECNPEILFIDGLEKAFKIFENQFIERLNIEKFKYSQLIKINPINKNEIDYPNIDDYGFSAFTIDTGLTYQYYFKDIVRINEGLNLFKQNNSEQKNKTIKDLPQLKPNLSDQQINTLFEILKDGKFIPDTTDRESFLWAFGCDKQPDNWHPIEWLKKKNLAVYLIDKLCFDPENITNFWSIGSKIFGIKNMAQLKDGYLNTRNTLPIGWKNIDEIINKAKGAI